MQCNNSTGQVLVAASIETGCLHHGQQRLLVWMHANRFGEILITVLIAGDELAKYWQHFERIEIISRSNSLGRLGKFEDQKFAARFEYPLH